MKEDFAQWVVNRAKERSKNGQKKNINFEGGRKETDWKKLDEKLKSEEPFDIREEI
jgi:hypothetical protein